MWNPAAMAPAEEAKPHTIDDLATFPDTKSGPSERIPWNSQARQSHIYPFSPAY
jgi:hypothetical protein